MVLQTDAFAWSEVHALPVHAQIQVYDLSILRCVFDAFGTAHRKKASTYGAIKSALASAPGLLLEKEISSLKSVLDNYKNPYIAVIGGSKVSTKLGLIENLINGSTIPMITLNQFKNIKIPIPKSQEKIQEWVDKISTPYNEKNEKQNKIKKKHFSIHFRG